MSFLARSSFAGAAVSAMLIRGAATALADDAPPAPARPTARGRSGRGDVGVSAGTSVYLFTHRTSTPSSPASRASPGTRSGTRPGYMDANPQVRAEPQGIRQPAADFRSRCG